jgi:transcriptional regulator with XRE-family HTH domain
MTRISELHKKWLGDEEYAQAYDELGTEFELARQMIEARARAGLTQDELAVRMHTSRTVIVRLESGKVLPSTRTLERLAAATGCRLRISLEPLATQ